MAMVHDERGAAGGIADDEVGRWLERAEAGCARMQRPPSSTYRLQLHREFGFRDAESILPYLERLGVDTVYVSPILKASPGSTHGYDITDHRTINPEVGSDDEFASWTAAIRARGLGLLLDVVPNHMGIVGNQNPWWNSVLEHGRASPHASAFDILWMGSPRPELRGRVLLPVLGDLYGRLLEAGELTLTHADGSFAIHYHEHVFPLDPRSYDQVLEAAVEELAAALGEEHPNVLEARSVLRSVRLLPEHHDDDTERVAERQRESEVVKRRIATLARDCPEFAAALDRRVAEINGRPGEARSFDALDALLEAQPYRLSYWRVAHDEINYRRFFDVNSLVAIRIDREEVFEASHDLILGWLADGRVNGLRIDHPDGLLDPRTYFERLQDGHVLRVARRLHESEVGDTPWADVEPAFRRILAATDAGRSAPPPLYVVAEKILEWDEPLPADWHVRGTTGYDGIARINGLFVEPSAERAFTDWYDAWTGDDAPLSERVRANKMLILETSLSSELHMLSLLLDRVAQTRRRWRDFTLNTLRQALAEVISVFPVYRTYITPDGPSPADRAIVDRAIRTVLRHPNLATPRAVLTFLREVLLAPPGPDAPEEHALFVGKYQQVTSAAMAKGLEDTTFYAYSRLVSLNEVGGDPGRFGVPPVEVHAWCRRRAADRPGELTPLTTHDTKRSEDVRSRINVLSEIPRRWFEAVARWSRMNARLQAEAGDLSVPGRDEELLLYQTLVGAWPFGRPDDAAWESFRSRVRDYMVKAVHEAKVHTSWINPDADYDSGIAAFVDRVTDRAQNEAFLDEMQAFVEELSRPGVVNSLAQTTVRLTIPGVPDTYQGTELWDLSLVDPDNRRPVDYDLRRGHLDEIAGRWESGEAGRAALLAELLDSPGDGQVKLLVTWRLLNLRRALHPLFTAGDYQPIEPRGAQAEHVFAFRRALDGREVAVVVPRLTVKLMGESPGWPLGESVWTDTAIDLPPGRWEDAFTAARIESTGPVTLAALLARFPVAVVWRTS